MDIQDSYSYGTNPSETGPWSGFGMVGTVAMVPNIPKPDTIQNPDMSGFRIPTVTKEIW